MPNWLREEIKKVGITNSSMDHPKEKTESVEDEGVDRSFGKGDLADSKSIDSSRSTEEDDDEVLFSLLKMVHFSFEASPLPLVNYSIMKLLSIFSMYSVLANSYLDALHLIIKN